MKYIIVIYQGGALERQGALSEEEQKQVYTRAYRRARDLTDDGPERRFLERRLTELAAATGEGLAACSTGGCDNEKCGPAQLPSHDGQRHRANVSATSPESRSGRSSAARPLQGPS